MGKHSGDPAEQQPWGPEDHQGETSGPTTDGSAPAGSGQHRADDDD